MLLCHPKILAGKTLWDFYMSFEDRLIVTFLSGTKGKMKKNGPKLQVSQNEPLDLKTMDKKLLKSTVGMAELPYEPKLACATSWSSSLPPLALQPAERCLL